MKFFVNWACIWTVLNICCSSRYQRLQILLVFLFCLFSWLWSMSTFIHKESMPYGSSSCYPLFLSWSLIVKGCSKGGFLSSARKSPLLVDLWLAVMTSTVSPPPVAQLPHLQRPLYPSGTAAFPIYFLEPVSPVEYFFPL